MTNGPPRAAAPELAPGDVYIHALANGAVFVLESDGRSRLAPLDDALAVAVACEASGCRVRFGRQPGPLADDVDRRLRNRGVTLHVVAGAVAPQTWDAGTTALMEAAAAGNDRLLDDLVTRQATLEDRDVSGSTALHHAAAAGNLHAIDALVAAGLDPDQPNAEGFTPYRLAIAARRLEAGQRLADLGADTGAGAGAPVTFHRSHRRAMQVWLVLPVLDVVVAVVVGVTVHPLVGLVVGAALLAVLSRLAPPRQLWAGGAPLRLEGTTLTVQGLGAARQVDLRSVTVAAIEGVERPAVRLRRAVDRARPPRRTARRPGRAAPPHDPVGGARWRGGPLRACARAPARRRPPRRGDPRPRHHPLGTRRGPVRRAARPARPRPPSRPCRAHLLVATLTGPDGPGTRREAAVRRDGAGPGPKDVVRYDPGLGAKGIAAYRREVAATWSSSTCPMRRRAGPGTRSSGPVVGR